MIDIITNPKHKLIIQLLYSAGLRVSELISLKISAIDLDRKIILVKQSKGRKDRYTLLAEKLIPILKKQKSHKDNNDYLFTSRDKKVISML